MKNFDYIYDSDGCLRHRGWKLSPWPRFRMERISSEEVGPPGQVLLEVLASDDVFCLLWRGQIPEDVLRKLRRILAKAQVIEEQVCELLLSPVGNKQENDALVSLFRKEGKNGTV